MTRNKAISQLVAKMFEAGLGGVFGWRRRGGEY